MNGIYCFIDLKDDSIVYIGKDSYIDKNKRFNDHYANWAYNHQKINKVLQSNLKRYKYKVLKQGNFKDNLLNALEILYIRRYRPKFNFTIGGEGIRGHTLSEETCRKISEAKRGVKYSIETRQKLSELRKGPNNPFYGKTHTPEVRKKISKAHTLDYPRIVKHGFNGGKQSYCIKRNGAMLKESVYIERLVEWFEENFPNEKLIVRDFK